MQCFLVVHVVLDSLHTKHAVGVTSTQTRVKQVAGHVFLAALDTTGGFSSLTGRFCNMMRIFCIRSLWTSAQRAWQPFGPPRAGPSLFTAVWRANPQRVGVASPAWQRHSFNSDSLTCLSQ